jgi:hypothetical protein
VLQGRSELWTTAEHCLKLAHTSQQQNGLSSSNFKVKSACVLLTPVDEGVLLQYYSNHDSTECSYGSSATSATGSTQNNKFTTLCDHEHSPCHSVGYKLERHCQC